MTLVFSQIGRYFQFDLQYFLSGNLSISFMEMEIARSRPGRDLQAPQASGIPILSVCGGSFREI